jgi:hypothetical protein
MVDYGEIVSFRNLPDAERLPAFRIRQSGNELHKKREKCNTPLFFSVRTAILSVPERLFTQKPAVLSAASELEYLHHDIGLVNVISHSPDSGGIRLKD